MATYTYCHNFFKNITAEFGPEVASFKLKFFNMPRAVYPMRQDQTTAKMDDVKRRGQRAA